MIRRSLAVVLAVLTMMMMATPVGASGVAADHDSPDEPDPTLAPTRVEAPMRLTGKAIPAEDGYRIVPIQTEETPGGSYVPDDSVPGDCGSSYIEIEPYSGGFTMNTGFVVNEEAVDFWWRAQSEFEPNPSLFQEFFFDTGPMLPDRRWDASVDYDVDSEAPIPIASKVVPASYAILWNLQVCSSAYPTDSAWVYP